MEEMESNQQLLDRLLRGQSLYTVMIPDPAIPSNRPEHIEGLHLSHIVSEDGLFWGMSNGNLFFSNEGKSDALSHGRFCYGNHSPFFFSSTHDGAQAVLMDITRYKSHQWKFIDDYELIWESDQKEDFKAIEQAVQDSNSLKIVMLDSQGIWNIHPVEITYANLEENSFLLRTSLCNYPLFVREKKDFNFILDEAGAREKLDIVRESHYEIGVGVAFKTQPYVATYEVSPDKTYKTFYDVLRGDTFTSYQILKIFAKKRQAEPDYFMMDSHPDSHLNFQINNDDMEASNGK